MFCKNSYSGNSTAEQKANHTDRSRSPCPASTPEACERDVCAPIALFLSCFLFACLYLLVGTMRCGKAVVGLPANCPGAAAIRPPEIELGGRNMSDSRLQVSKADHDSLLHMHVWLSRWGDKMAVPPY